MNGKLIIILVISSFLFFLLPIKVVACDPDCGDCYEEDGYGGCELICNCASDRPCSGCCVCENCCCHSVSYFCGDSCRYCYACDCYCSAVDNIGGVFHQYYYGYVGETVYARKDGGYTPNCSFIWDGDANIEGSGQLVTATFDKTTGTGLTIKAKSTCQGSFVHSSTFAVVRISEFEADPDNFPKCVGDSISKDDFIIETDPTGYEDQVVVTGLTTASSGIKTAEATLWSYPNPPLEASYTVVGCPVDEYYGCGCVDGECEDCWEFATVPANDAQPCPECSNAMGGCYSTHTRIPEEYAVYVANILDPPAPGQWGVCGRHYETEPVRYLTTCVEYQTNVMAVIDVIVNLGLDLSTWTDCGLCYTTFNPAYCYKCIKGVIAGELIDDLPCIWVSECDRCNYSDEACSYPLNTPNVVDWDAVEHMCTNYI